MSASQTPVRVVLCWHMHQPHYFDRESNQYQLPWTYLHAIKDYVDMAAIIEATDGARAVVNFAPTLLEQIDDYAQQVNGFLTQDKPLKDPLLNALVSPALPAEPEQCLSIIKACLRANRERLINRFKPYKRLAKMADFIDNKTEYLAYLSSEYFADILTWYHLAWIGETVRRKDKRIKRLMKKAHGYTLKDRCELLTIIGELLDKVLPMYRRLAEEGKVELSVTPYAHPIVPLLLDIESTHEAMPDADLPILHQYPGGEERSRWHIHEGLRVFEEHFGFRPKGCWPSEGAVSEAALRLFDEEGFSWVATGESVLRHSLAHLDGDHPACIHRPYQLGDTPVQCFFRDDGLSDLIGFTYANWHADDAVNNLVHHIENIADACAHEPNRVISIILDGENAWEYYPENGYYFLSALYERLAQHKTIELTTFEKVQQAEPKPYSLNRLVAGSWVYGTFSTWIGDADKNRGWDYLIEAKQCFDKVISSGRLNEQQQREAERQMAICEGSDWFWWFGDYNPSDSVKDFDRLYRLQLAELYRILGEPPPEHLTQVISQGGGGKVETGGVMRRGKEA